ncbi:MAG TPA: hypothetical protein VG944_07010 [Fimbriimonas sp.]|nr:hypothetical protein [Fimbriimonas sp.]
MLFAVAVTVTVVAEATGTVVTVKVALVAPATTVTEAGVVAAEESSESDTTKPPVGAGPEITTVPVEDVPPVTVVGLILNDETVGAVIVSVAVLEAPLAVAVIVAEVLLATAVVLTVNVAVEAPAATVTEAGTVADPELLLRLTTMPPVGAAELIVTVPVEVDPPTTDVGETVTPVTAGGVIVSVAVFVTELFVAVMVAVVLEATAVVVTVNVPVVEPEGTTTELGTVADPELLLSATAKPVEGAAEVSVTVPVDDVPPATLVGDTDTALNAGAVIVSVAVAVVAPLAAVIVSVEFDPTATVVTVNVAVVLPEGTVTDAGRVVAVLVSDRVIVSPAAGAWPVRVTVPVEEVPPGTLVGFTLTDKRSAGLIVRSAVKVAVPAVAVTVAVVAAETAVVDIVKVADVEPEGTVTVAGTEADELLSLSVTEMPEEGAAPVRVTVPVDELPPTTEVGLSETPESVGGVTVREAFRVVVPSVKGIVPELLLATGVVLIVKVAELEPAGIVTDDGTTM